MLEQRYEPTEKKSFLSKKLGDVKTFHIRNNSFEMLFCCLIIWALYICFALLINGNLFTTSSQNYYNYLLESFLHGRVNVTPLSTFDLSLYKNKWYMYWGPAPTLFILPFYLISHLQASDTLYTLIGGAGNVILFYFVMMKFQKYFSISLSLPTQAFLLFSFGLASPNFVLSMNGHVWFTCQIFAISYLLLFYLCFFMFLDSERIYLFILATVFFYLAVLSRYSLIFNGIFYLYLILHYRLSGREIPRIIFLSFSVLTLVFVSLLSTYNYLKFGNVLETGLRYQQGDPRFHSILKRNQIFSPSYIWHNVYYYFLNIVHFSPLGNPVVIDLEGNSVFSVYPALLLLPALYYNRNYLNRKRLLFLATASAIVIFSTIFLMFFFATGWQQFGSRYFFDVVPILFLLLIFILEYVPFSIQLAILLFGMFVNFYGSLSFFAQW